MEAQNNEQREQLKTQLLQLSNFPGWKLVRSELENIVTDIEFKLFEPDANKNELKFTQHDINRIERKILKMFINLPKDLFDELDAIYEIVDEWEEE